MRFTLLRIGVYLLPLLSTSFHCWAGEVSNAAKGETSAMSSRDILYTQLHKPSEYQTLELSKKKTRVELEVCKDQCGYFEAPSNAPIVTFWDFVFMFEYWGRTVDESDTFRANTESHERVMLEKYASECPKVHDVSETERCAWVALAKKHKFRVGIVGYDEGYRCQAILES